MTPERKKWWDSLPKGERELREAIAEHEKWIKINKSYLPDGSTDIEYLKKMLRRHKLITKALKHELERGGKTTMEMTSVKTPMPPVNLYCHSCRSVVAISAIELKFCPNCGRKINGINKNKN